MLEDGAYPSIYINHRRDNSTRVNGGDHSTTVSGGVVSKVYALRTNKMLSSYKVVTTRKREETCADIC